ncbi:MAG: hypothetical protein OHK0013_02150 [Sandaracinaceae bacterium]
MRCASKVLGAIVTCAVLLLAPDAHAQRGRRGTPPTSSAPAAEPARTADATAPAAPAVAASREPSAADRQAAGQAYDRATAAYLARNYGQAATLFETAYRLAPASAALVQAVRSHERAGNAVRAATLALRLQAFYGAEDAARRQAEQTLAATASQLLRIDVACAGTCTLELDGVIQEHTSFFASPGTEHTVRATFDTGAIERAVTGAAGATERLSFEAPPPPAEVATGGESGDPDGTTAPPTPVDRGGGGLSPALFVTGLVATAISGGILIGAGVHALSGVPSYNAMPTVEGLRDGQSRELFTNVMIGVTGALALTTLVFAVLTDWDGAPSTAEGAPVQTSLVVAPDLALLQIGRRF